MSNIVEQIYDSVVTLTGTELGATWTRLSKVFDPAQNNFREINQAFGVRPRGALTSEGVTRVYTMDHTFDVLLAKRASSRDSDLAILETEFILFSAADELFKKFFLSKLALPSIVLIVNSPSLSDPEVLDNGCVLLTASFNVKYRNLID